MVIPITHGGHTYHRQRQTDTAAMVYSNTSSWSFVPSSETNRYVSDGHSNYSWWSYVPSSEKKPIQPRWSFQYLIVAIRTIVREKTGTAARVIPINTSSWLFVPSSETNRYGSDGHSNNSWWSYVSSSETKRYGCDGHSNTSSWLFVPSSETNRYGSDGHSNNSWWSYVPSSEKKPIRLRWSFQYLIVVIRTIVRDKPIRQRWSFQ